jgi:hypothetical protein
MNRITLLLVIVAVVSLIMEGQTSEPIPAKQNGMELLEECNENTHGFESGYCLGLIRGVSMASSGICDEQITLGQEKLVVEKFLKDNPEKLNQPDVTLIWMALTKAFPCPKVKQ